MGSYSTDLERLCLAAHSEYGPSFFKAPISYDSNNQYNLNKNTYIRMPSLCFLYFSIPIL